MIPKSDIRDILLAHGGTKPTLELFPGTAVWSSYHARIGFETEVHDWKDGALPEFDMTSPEYVDGRLCPAIERKQYSAIQIATECTTFSTMTGCTYRTKVEPEGTDECLQSGLPKADKCLSANVYAANSVKVFLKGDEAGAICTLDNPLGSRLFALETTQPLIKRIKDGSLWLVATSYCSFGTRFRGTRLIIVNRPWLQKLSKPCKHGPGGHDTILAAHRTPCKEANQYPAGLCRLWAQLTAEIVVAETQQ